jgi:hypothetical protein
MIYQRRSSTMNSYTNNKNILNTSLTQTESPLSKITSTYRNPAYYDGPLSTERRAELTRKGRCVPGERTPIIKITLNTQFDKPWHQRTGLIFESKEAFRKDRKVMGRVFNGVIYDLDSDDIEICKEFGWRYVE